VGHAVRSVDDALRAARGDTTILTASLETRLLAVDAALYDEFTRRVVVPPISRRSSRSGENATARSAAVAICSSRT